MTILLADLGPDTAVDVVLFGSATPAASTDPVNVARGLAEHRVQFSVCENSMRAQDVTAADLLSGMPTVTSGAGHIVARQRPGWSHLHP